MGIGGIFLAMAGGLLLADLLAHRRQQVVSLGDAARWCALYMQAAILFAGHLYWTSGPEDASAFLSGYVMEKALSIDNLMVFVAIFAYFRIPDAYQHKVLHWGIWCACLFRLAFVAAGAGSLQLLGPPIGMIFGLLVLWSAFKMWTTFEEPEPVDYAAQWYVRWAERILPFMNFLPESWRGEFFWTVLTNSNPSKQLRWTIYGTPLLLALVAIEISDVLFSFDSVPAVIVITQKPLLVYSAMIFAILGLRQLYFVLSALMRFLTRLQGAVVLILAFIGVKMVSGGVADLMARAGHPTPGSLHADPIVSLCVVLVLLAGGVIASIVWPKKEETSASITR